MGTTGCKVVLLVEDDRITQHLYRAFLQGKEASWHVVLAHDGLVALLLLARIQPDVVIFDWHVEGLEGGMWLLAKQDIERQAQRPYSPVVVVTADPQVLRRDVLGRMGVQAFLTKPILPDVLCAAVQGALAAAEDTNGHDTTTPVAAQIPPWANPPAAAEAPLEAEVEASAKSEMEYGP